MNHEMSPANIEQHLEHLVANGFASSVDQYIANYNPGCLAYLESLLVIYLVGRAKYFWWKEKLGHGLYDRFFWPNAVGKFGPEFCHGKGV